MELKIENVKMKRISDVKKNILDLINPIDIGTQLFIFN